MSEYSKQHSIKHQFSPRQKFTALAQRHARKRVKNLNSKELGVASTHPRTCARDNWKTFERLSKHANSSEGTRTVFCTSSGEGQRKMTRLTTIEESIVLMLCQRRKHRLRNATQVISSVRSNRYNGYRFSWTILNLTLCVAFRQQYARININAFVDITRTVSWRTTLCNLR